MFDFTTTLLTAKKVSILGSSGESLPDTVYHILTGHSEKYGRQKPVIASGLNFALFVPFPPPPRGNHSAQQLGVSQADACLIFIQVETDLLGI